MGTYRWWLWLLLWIQNPRVHSSMVRAANCRSGGPWFNSGWRSWFIFMTGSHNLMNHPAQRYNTMSPIRTVITTITRKSVNMVAELDYDTSPSRIGQLYSSQGCCGDFSGVGHKGPCSTGNSCSTEERTRSISTVQDRNQGSACDCSQATERIRSRHRGGPNTKTTLPESRWTGSGTLHSVWVSRDEQSQEQHVRPDKDQLTTDTADLKMTKDAVAEDTTAFEDTTQDCLVCQTKVAYFEVYTNKNLSEELEALVKAKILISEKTDDADNR